MRSSDGHPAQLGELTLGHWPGGANLYPLLLPEVVPLMPGCWPLSSILFLHHPGLGPPAHFHQVFSGLSPPLSPSAQHSFPRPFFPKPYLAQVRRCSCTVSLWFLAWNKFFLIQEVSATGPSSSLGRAKHVEKLQLVWGRQTGIQRRKREKGTREERH